MTVPRSASAGLVLAAGASSRMGQPKALLGAESGRPLAALQADLLRQAGCDPVLVVLGASAGLIAPHLEGHQTITHPGWATGRLSSIQAGLHACPAREGYIILPVDAVGIAPDTIVQLLQESLTGQHTAIRPFYRTQPGHLLWISQKTADAIMRLAPHEDLSLRDALADQVTRLDLDDPALLTNINSPADWAAFCSS